VKTLHHQNQEYELGQISATESDKEQDNLLEPDIPLTGKNPILTPKEIIDQRSDISHQVGQYVIDMKQIHQDPYGQCHD
jgi:hypothetical protein